MTVTSSFDALHQAIHDCNPFESHFIVKASQVWEEDYPDVPSLHAHASDAILETLDKINNGKILSKTAGFALIATKGIGKTHVLSRIRQQIKQKDNGMFIYMSEYGNLSQIKRQFLQGLAASLKRKGGKDVMQWQELATALINQALQKNHGCKFLIERCSQPLSNKTQMISQLSDKVAISYPEVQNPYVIRAILWTLSAPHAAFAVNWLAGGELSEAQAKQMDLTDKTKDEEEPFSRACQILKLIGSYTTPIICFDELDGSEVADEEDELAGFTRAQVVACLVKDLYNNLDRGILITSVYGQTWSRDIQALAGGGGATKDRMAHQELELRLLKPDDAVALVAGCLQKFYAERNLTPPNPVYPFEENTLRDIGNGAAIRDVLQWCAKNFGTPVDPHTLLEKIYQQIATNPYDFSDDDQRNQHIGNALAFAMDFLKGETIEKVTINKIEKTIRPKAQHNGYINFKIEGTEAGKQVSIGVCVLENSGGKKVGAVIGHLTKYDLFGLTRGCLIRSKTIDKKWQVANANLKKLLTDQGGEWISPQEADINTLLILHQMHKDLDREQFSDEIFHQFIAAKCPLSENALIREILSDPSGQAPENIVDVDADLNKLIPDPLDKLLSGLNTTVKPADDFSAFLSVG